MVIDPEIPDERAEPRLTAHRRFARLVESPVGRRLVPRRLLVAVTISLVILAGATFVGLWLKDRLKAWVDGRPEYQLPFADIRLDPEPPAYIRPGMSGLLEQVRVEAAHPERVGLLKLDTEALVNDFRRSPWVESVIKVDRTYRGLTVHLSYRRPVALVQFSRKEGKPGAEVIDRSGVILSKDDLDRADLRVRGLDMPLIAIREISAPFEPVAGQSWKRRGATDGTGDPDPEVLGAARLAEFLRSATTKTPGGRDVPRIVSIWFTNRKPAGDPIKGYFVRDSDDNWIWWRDAPGDNPSGDLTATEKWTRLMKRVDDLGPIRLKNKERHYLKFTPSGIEIVTPNGS